MSVTTFRTPAEAVERANNSAYGLAAGVWTDNGSKAFEVACALRAGVVWQNTYNRFDPTAAFGGYKESGFGREGGPAGLLPYVRLAHEPPRAGRQDVQALPGRRVRALGVRPQRPDDRRAGEHVANVPRGSRKDVRDAVKAARGAPAAGRARPPTTAARSCTASPRRSSRAATSWRAPRAQRDVAADARAEVGAAVDLLVHYAGWTDKLAAVMGGINPVAAPYLSFSDARADRRRRRARARRARPARAGPRGRARRWRRATRSSRSSRAAGRCARWTSARSPASPTSRAAC